VFALFGVIELPSPASFAFTVIEIVWEASLAIYLTVRDTAPHRSLAETTTA
jgi:hypothetical protein